MIPLSKPTITEQDKQAVMAVLDSGMLVQGPRVAELEQRWAEVCQTRHAIATSNGTTALHVALLAHGIGPGDEVITTPFTFIASVNSIVYVGATPVFVDVCADSFNLDLDQIEQAITPRIKAILAVHLYGQSVAMDQLMAIAQRHHLLVIEDCAQAIGADFRGQPVGSFGTGCFSLYATKNVMSAEGGMITTNDDAVARKARMLRGHGMERRYHHDILGFNFRLSDLHAAIGLSQLTQLDQFTARRRYNAAYLSQHIRRPGVMTPVQTGGHVWHQYTVRVATDSLSRNSDCGGRLGWGQSPSFTRDEVVQKLTAAGIGVGVFYPIPAHQQRHLLEMKLGGGSFPVAEQLSREVLSLPVHPALTEDDLEKIAEAVNQL